LTARSFRLNSSKIALDHPFVLRGKAMGLAHYGSPTLSDQALLPNEFIYLKEIEEGIDIYLQLLTGFRL